MSDTPDIDALLPLLDPSSRALVLLMKQALSSMEAANAAQAERIAALTAEVTELRRLLFGRKAERVPDARRAARASAQSKKDPAQREAERLEQRRKNKADRESLPVVEHVLDVPDEERVCPCCGSTDLSPLGDGIVSMQIEYVPAHLVRIQWRRTRYACRCGKGIVTAPAPPQVTDGCEYGPGMHAHVVVSKCADALPFYRLAQQFQRAGMPVSRATLCTLFHRAADQVDALYEYLLDDVAAAAHVFADETPLPVLAEGGCDRGYVWTFVTDRVVAFTYSASRSGETAVRILGGTSGTLQADAYSGYNAVTTPEGRVRAGCWAHVRREFFRALDTAPVDAGEAMNRIALLYDVEHRAAEQGVVGAAAHRALRTAESTPRVDPIFEWLVERAPDHPPKSPMGKAIRYAQKQETALRQFLVDARVGLDNNAAERALKPVALGRKNFLFAGHDEGAENLAKLQTIVATCKRHGVNPQAYLEDVLVRVNTHPAKDIAALMPWSWQPAA